MIDRILLFFVIIIMAVSQNINPLKICIIIGLAFVIFNAFGSDFHKPQIPFHKPQIPFHNPQIPFHNPPITFHNPPITFHNPPITFHNPPITFHNPPQPPPQPSSLILTNNGFNDNPAPNDAKIYSFDDIAPLYKDCNSLTGDDKLMSKMQHLSLKNKEAIIIRAGFNKYSLVDYFNEELNDHENSIWWDNQDLEQYM
jgi:hypothetical protein